MWLAAKQMEDVAGLVSLQRVQQGLEAAEAVLARFQQVEEKFEVAEAESVRLQGGEE